MSDELRLRVPRAASKTITLQAWRDDHTIPTEFNQGMTIYSQVTRFNDLTGVLFQPTTTWYNASVGQFQVAFRQADTTNLEAGVFRIITYVVISSEPVAIFEGQVEVLPDARVSTNPLPDLITTVEAEAIVGALADDQYEMLPGFLSRVSQAIRTYTNQTLTYRLHDEVYRSREASRIVLRETPVRSVEALLCDPKLVLSVSNRDASNQRAYCWLTSSGDFLNGFVSTGLGFSRTSSGVKAPDQFVAWADAPTIGAVRDAVAALGNGWTATVGDGWLDDPSADLRGQATAKLACDRGSSAGFVLHSRRMSDFTLNEDDVIEFDVPWTQDQPWMWPNMPFEIVDRRLPTTVGAYAYRVVYYAGYKTVTGGFPSSEMPGDLMDAVGIILQANIAKKKLNPLFQSRSLADYSYSISGANSLYIPEEAREILINYRDPGRHLDPTT